MKYLVKAIDGNVFLAEKDDKGWIATKSHGQARYFAKGYITESQEI